MISFVYTQLITKEFEKNLSTRSREIIQSNYCRAVTKISSCQAYEINRRGTEQQSHKQLEGSESMPPIKFQNVEAQKCHFQDFPKGIPSKKAVAIESKPDNFFFKEQLWVNHVL